MISFILSRCSNAWNDFFTGTPIKYENQTYTSKQTLSGDSVYVLNCLFNGCFSTSGDGGALYYYNSAKKLLVESSSFFSCNTNSNGGAIYFSNTGSGECVLHKVCGYNCCSTLTSGYSHGQFSLIQVNDSASSKNYVNYSSISRCVNENSKSQFTLYHDFGKICCPSVNISMNKCYSQSGIYCYPKIDSSSVTCSFSYSSFVDNNATGNNCILFNMHANYEFKCCNILRNTQDSGSLGTIVSNRNLKIEDSCILENNATYIFYQRDPSYTITLSNCTVDKTTYNQNLTIQNTVTKDFILALTHMSTRNCHSEYDSVGTLTPYSNKQKHCYTGNNFRQLRLSDIVSLMCVLIFNFIHPDASSYSLYESDYL